MTVYEKEYVICVGAQKAGTTLLYDHLRHHPEINSTEKKELHYFDYGDEHSEIEYRKFFEGDKRINLDITPAYMFYTNAIEEIAKILPKEKVKLIIILRNPINRAISHFKMNVKLGIEKNNLKVALEKESKRLSKSEYHMRKYSYLKRGLYYPQLKKILTHFEIKKVHIVEFQQFVDNQKNEINKICSFLNISEIDVEHKISGSGVNIRSVNMHRLARKVRTYLPLNIENAFYHKFVEFYHKINTRSGFKKNEEIENKLKKFFKKDIKKLSKLTGLDFEGKWLEK